MRTVKRQAETINVAKKAALEDLCKAYGREKRYWLDVLQGKEFQSKLDTPRTIRDEAVQNKYQSLYGLQARMWKLALQDAIDTWNTYWESLFALVRTKLSRRFKTDEERHYAFWILKGFKQFTACMSGEVPLPSFSIDSTIAKKVCAYIQRK